MSEHMVDEQDLEGTPSFEFRPSVDAQVLASALTAFLLGRLHRYARSGFKRLPSEHLDASLALMI